jgi:hypothetical protein
MKVANQLNRVEKKATDGFLQKHVSTMSGNAAQSADTARLPQSQYVRLRWSCFGEATDRT